MKITYAIFFIYFFSTLIYSQTTEWNNILEHTSSSVVSIEVDIVRSFDTERNQSSQATGFIVDSELGIILTNRHVVTTGPVRARAIFSNQEKIQLSPLYRDPVHDFGFFKYDPNELRHIDPKALKFSLIPLKIGEEIRVLGNDAGEQLSILAGTIARLDRQAPDYGRGNYNDFNTFYYQAASSTSGGSSGAPVINNKGEVVALNAGANAQSASSFFLPLNRISRALQLIQSNSEITRGSLQTEFIYTPYSELRRLRFPNDVEEKIRSSFPSQNGMLVVSKILPGSEAEKIFMPGDILFAIDEIVISSFDLLASVLDENINQVIDISLFRNGNLEKNSISIIDLHSITPDSYIEYGGGVFHDLSYQQARHYNLPINGIYVADPGYIFGSAAVPRGSLVSEINNIRVDNLNIFRKIMESIPVGERVVVRFVQIDSPSVQRQRVIINDNNWFHSKFCERDIATELWPCENLFFSESKLDSNLEDQSFSFPEREELLYQISKSLVLVNFDMPYLVSGISDRHYYGTGLIVDKKMGLVVVDRNTVPVSIGDARITFSGSIEIPAKVSYIHPLHNLAIISYDTSLFDDSLVEDAAFSSSILNPRDRVTVVGLKANHQLFSQSSEIASIDSISLSNSNSFRFIDSNLDGIKLVNGPSDFDGVMIDSNGLVRALWSSFAYSSGREMAQTNIGTPISLVEDMVVSYKEGLSIKSLEVNWRYMPLSAARKFGVPDEWIERYELGGIKDRRMLAVSRTVAGSPVGSLFLTGDILLSIDEELIRSFRSAELASQKGNNELVLFRKGEVITLNINSALLSGDNINHIFSWAGALIQDPHRPISMQTSMDGKGVFISSISFGSPANRFGLYSGRKIAAINGKEIENLEHFVEVIKEIDNTSPVRVNTINWNGQSQIITLDLDEYYWPSYGLIRDNEIWRRYLLD
ncbi:MAG: trypsin-like peptidase domain-containing protein [Pseudomonadota bacterium]|nr:trypsin-like peptidase domain-containing protein [Pseudomonadota bacterium]|tara:strand:+ start:1391 stop:4180 length:2790 start_codon:yes stop_codon:yes gene_type:complete